MSQGSPESEAWFREPWPPLTASYPGESSEYDLLVIGEPTPAIAAAIESATETQRVAMVIPGAAEPGPPSLFDATWQALQQSARLANSVRTAEWLQQSPTKSAIVDFGAVVERLRHVQLAGARRASTWRLLGHGVDVYRGAVRFIASHGIELGEPDDAVPHGISGDNVLRIGCRRCVLVVGRQPNAAAIDGLTEVGYRLPASILERHDLPRRAAVLGAGSQACMLAQALRRFGSDVHLIASQDALLSGEAPEVSQVIRRQFERESIHLRLGCEVTRVERTGDAKGIILACGDQRTKVFVDDIFLTASTTTRHDRLDLDAALVRTAGEQIAVDDHFRTSNPAIFAIPDSVATIAIANLTTPRFDSGCEKVLRTIYTDPEVAQLGLTPAEADRRGIAIDIHYPECALPDDAMLENGAERFAMAYTRKDDGRLSGATVVGANAAAYMPQLQQVLASRPRRTGIAGVRRVMMRVLRGRLHA
ncbi:MAG TPA: FAD-dependent oxidoreductase [Pirellulales bacterium]|jgi:pyruvate/2-oxoglutarate dehydrogenase complex dihydrolipoamide dehydrogenase (E3) component|nr:FAD-dependent oxidoreductase [Pirellulales bacterium]